MRGVVVYRGSIVFLGDPACKFNMRIPNLAAIPRWPSLPFMFVDEPAKVQTSVLPPGAKAGWSLW